ncbi:MAG: DUF1292 domain-containing protein [Candidatus Cohnella colombiensis]|uniref:UPF0473 protein P0Y55_11115 n=1 Tax=Candidatus Cohnella colombiensis TaxID=3121368 RepID=A0AA95ETW2_9BACL|nr:MAG: DUF1292 domain-containing protein [Cohnella sp.]
MSNDEQYDEIELIRIPNEEGGEDEFEVLMRIEPNDGSDRKYILLIPTDGDENEEEPEVFPFRYEEDEDGIHLSLLEDPEEWELVQETFDTLNGDFDDVEGEEV